MISRCLFAFLSANMAANMSAAAVGFIRVQVANYKFQIEYAVITFYYNTVIVLVPSLNLSYVNHNYNRTTLLLLFVLMGITYYCNHAYKIIYSNHNNILIYIYSLIEINFFRNAYFY